MFNGFLRQSTASQSRLVGPFIDDTDFKALETGLTIANTDVKLSKNGAASVNKNSGGGTHRVNGKYSLTFDATDTNTVGELDYSIAVTGALVVTGKFMVLEEPIYDALFAASAGGFNASGQVTVGSIAAGAITAAAIASNAIDADAIAADAVSEIQFGLATLANQTTIAGYIDTEVAAIKAVTDNLPDGGALTSLAADVAAILADTGSDGVVLSAATQQAIADALLDRADAIETGWTLRQVLRILAAAIAGEISGADSTTMTIRDIADSKTRITATVDSSGNRSALTLDAS